MLKRLKSLLKDSSGNVAMIGGLLILPIMSVVGATIDYTNYINLRNDIQISLDAAGLAAGREVAAGEDDENALEVYSEQFFEANLADDIDRDSYEFNFAFIPGNSNTVPATPDQVELSVDIDYQLIFGGIIGHETLSEKIKSIVSLGNRTVEVALVLDNSGSMDGDKIDTLITESKALVDTVFNSSQLTTLPDPVQFSLVPFSASVNIGTNNRNRNWMDRRGWSPVHHENFDWENTYRTNNDTQAPVRDGLKIGFRERIDGRWRWKTRHDVFEMVGETWGGCVEMRPWPHNVMDTVAFTNANYRTVRDSVDANNDGVGDGTSALFVPFFAPDEPDGQFAEQDADFGQIFPVSPNTDHDDDEHGYRNDYLYDFQDYDQNDPVAYPNDRDQLHTDETKAGLPHGNPALDVYGSDRQIERTNWMFKYQRNAQYN
ncbi:MAG: pilus assembly protein, partial [Pseudomonadota bacterium]